MEIRFNGHLVSFVVNYNFLFYYFPEFSGKTPFIANAIQAHDPHGKASRWAAGDYFLTLAFLFSNII